MEFLISQPSITPNSPVSNQQRPSSTPNAQTTLSHKRPNKHATTTVASPFEKRKAVAFFTSGRYIGSLRAEEFLSTFLPYQHPNARRLKPRKERLDLMRSVASQQSEAEMYKPFVQALENWPPRDPDRKIKLVYKDCHSVGDPNCGGLSVDISIGTSSTRRFWEDKCYIPFSEQESHVKIKFCDSSDPFCDRQMRQRNVQSQEEEEQEYEAGMDDDQCVGDDLDNVDIPSPLPDCGPEPAEDESDDNAEAGQKGFVWEHHPFENMTPKGISCRGQIAYYAAALLAVQYRVFFLQLINFGQYARFVRWDRSCAIVSERFSYVEEPEFIFDFYCRFAQLDSISRGYDPSIAMVSKEEADRARAEFKKFSPDGWHGRSQLPQRLYRTIHEQPFRSVEMPDGHRFIICVPVFSPDRNYIPFGRCTRRSLAFDPGTGSVHFYKDSQSQNYSTILKEAQVYERINDKRRIGEVPRGLCTMISGGNVPNTEAIGHEYWEEEWVYGNVREPIQLITHRIVLKEVGASIKAFTNIKTLLTCVADAMEAHTWLVHELRLLHRDISPGNILMEREADEHNVRRGYLIDFDHALDLARADPLHPPGRAGTFLFLAAALHLDDSQVVQSEKDDRESLFHSIVYLGLLHAQHSLSNRPIALERQLNLKFENAGCDAKSGAFFARSYSKIRWANPGLQRFVEELEPVFASRYLDLADCSRSTPKDLVNIVNLDTRSWMDTKIWEIVRTMPSPPEMEFINNEHYPPATATKRAYERQNTENRLGFDGHLV